jgi:hypothetical protein
MKREECRRSIFGENMPLPPPPRESNISRCHLGGKYEKSRETEGKYEINVRKRSDNGKRYPYLRGKI